MSAIDSSGLVGVSTQISPGWLFAATAAWTASGSETGHRLVADAPRLRSTLSNSRNVPP